MASNKIIHIQKMGFPWQTQDPFLFCARHRDEYPAGDSKMGLDSEYLAGRMMGSDFVVKDGFRMYHGQHIPGFPYHPHRGFETITINKEGYVDHTDSLGAAGRFGAGDVQWMTAGKGLQHSEMFPMLYEDKGNPLEIFQVWLNLPAKSKMVEPHFKMLWKEEVPLIIEKDENGKSTEVILVAGKLDDKKQPPPTPDSWAADPNHAVRILTLKMDAGAKWTLPATSEEAHRSLYFYRGHSLKIEGERLEEYHMAILHADEDLQIVNGEDPGFLLILEGKPIGEPVAQHGPFVMNSEQEIRQAMKDYGATQFGGWPWPGREYVHDRNKGRFALHADGREELK